MALQVSADVVHPAAYLQDRRDLTSALPIWEGTRVFLVQNLTTGSSTDAMTMHARAKLAPGIPLLNDPHPSPDAAAAGCIVKDRRTQTIPESDDALYVLVDYWTIIPSFSGGVGIISVDRDTVLTSQLGDLNLADGQITVKPPSGNAAEVPAELITTFPLRKMVITAAVRQQVMDGFEMAVGTVNNDLFFGMNAGYWRFDRMHDLQQLGNATIAVVTEFVTQNFRNWNQFVVRRTEAFGQNIKLDPTVVAAALAKPYKYGITKLAGITVVGQHPTISFGSLFGVTHWP